MTEYTLTTPTVITLVVFIILFCFIGYATGKVDGQMTRMKEYENLTLICEKTVSIAISQIHNASNTIARQESEIQNLIMYCDPSELGWALNKTNENLTVYGLASPDKGYFLVWAKDQNINDTLNVAAHEWGHFNGLVDK